jgi:hypothetical protein
MGKCPLCAISASSTPWAASVGREAVLGCDVALDVDEARDRIRVLVGEHERGEVPR